MTATWSGYALTGALAVFCLLQSRLLGSRWQRVAVLLPGLYGGLLLTILLAEHMTATWRLSILAGLLALVAVLLVCAWAVPGTRRLPYWGRIAEVLHSLFALSLLPLLLAVLGGYGWARTLF
jgi:hypothetical protein